MSLARPQVIAETRLSTPWPTRGASGGLDLVPQADGSFSLSALLNFIEDRRYEPDWRPDAEIEYNLYDGEQLSMDIMRKMRDLGMIPVIANLIGPSIDSVSGFEVLTRSSIRVIPETEDDYDVALGVNQRFKEMLRLTRFNDHVSDQFKCSSIIGVGWLEVGLNPDPFGYPFFAKMVPWREIWWDFRSRSSDIVSDARYILRRKAFDADELRRHFPNAEAAIAVAASGQGNTNHSWQEDFLAQGRADQMGHSLDNLTRTTIEDEDRWNNFYRDRVFLYEVLYRVPRRAVVLRLSDGYTIELNPDNPFHRRHIDMGGQVMSGVTQQWRQAWIIGQTRVADRPLQTQHPHYIPMIWNRRDSDGAPYGLVRRQRSQQETTNANLTRIYADRSSETVMFETDAPAEPDVLREEMNRTRRMIPINPKRSNLSSFGVSISQGAETTPVSLQLLQQSREDIFAVTGIYPAFQGVQQASSKSGIAIEKEVEQVTQVLGTPIRNYRRSRELAAQVMLEIILGHDGAFDNMKVSMDEPDERGAARHIILNARAAPHLERTNDILMARLKIALGEAPETATYLQQKFQQLVEIVKSMPPEMQVIMMDLVVRAAALPDGEEILDRVREVTGHGPLPKDPAKRQAIIQSAETQKRLQEIMEEMQMRLANADIALKEAQAQKAAEQARKTAEADTGMTMAQIEKAMAEVAEKRAGVETAQQESRRRDTEVAAKMIGEAAKLRHQSNKNEQDSE